MAWHGMGKKIPTPAWSIPQLSMIFLVYNKLMFLLYIKHDSIIKLVYA